MYQPHDYVNQPNDYIPTAVIHDRRRLRINWATAGAYITAALGLGIAIAVTALFLGYKGSVAGQMSQLRQEVAKAQSAAKSANARNAGSINSLSGKVASLGKATSVLSQFGMVCSQDLTGPNGPAQFFFPCSDQRP